MNKHLEGVLVALSLTAYAAVTIGLVWANVYHDLPFAVPVGWVLLGFGFWVYKMHMVWK